MAPNRNVTRSHDSYHAHGMNDATTTTPPSTNHHESPEQPVRTWNNPNSTTKNITTTCRHDDMNIIYQSLKSFMNRYLIVPTLYVKQFIVNNIQHGDEFGGVLKYIQCLNRIIQLMKLIYENYYHSSCYLDDENLDDNIDDPYNLQEKNINNNEILLDSHFVESLVLLNFIFGNVKYLQILYFHGKRNAHIENQIELLNVLLHTLNVENDSMDNFSTINTRNDHSHFNHTMNNNIHNHNNYNNNNNNNDNNNNTTTINPTHSLSTLYQNLLQIIIEMNWKEIYQEQYLTLFFTFNHTHLQQSLKQELDEMIVSNFFETCTQQLSQKRLQFKSMMNGLKKRKDHSTTIIHHHPHNNSTTIIHHPHNNSTTIHPHNNSTIHHPQHSHSLQNNKTHPQHFHKHDLLESNPYKSQHTLHSLFQSFQIDYHTLMKLSHLIEHAHQNVYLLDLLFHLTCLIIKTSNHEYRQVSDVLKDKSNELMVIGAKIRLYCESYLNRKKEWKNDHFINHNNNNNNNHHNNHHNNHNNNNTIHQLQHRFNKLMKHDPIHSMTTTNATTTKTSTTTTTNTTTSTSLSNTPLTNNDENSSSHHLKYHSLNILDQLEQELNQLEDFLTNSIAKKELCCVEYLKSHRYAPFKKMDPKNGTLLWNSQVINSGVNIHPTTTTKKHDKHHQDDNFNTTTSNTTTTSLDELISVIPAYLVLNRQSL